MGLCGLRDFEFLGQLANVGGSQEQREEVDTEGVCISALNRQAALAGAGGEGRKNQPGLLNPGCPFDLKLCPLLGPLGNRRVQNGRNKINLYPFFPRHPTPPPFCFQRS